ncbi:PAS and ANTAR domain-containing protein [Mycobacterium sp. GA-2829]|uniref:PAS and ANTAR domain-containing protein n=1 Tax=Mycobacterium sp. GA-2829 TaxID=1772283 RepID=UPI000740124F|nr:PAS and ANTAR domain-containing protein [Mycobacterium sp. GA-2829]KUI38539.1 antitermination regulator [Mycobacterium sp. GA-2829]
MRDDGLGHSGDGDSELDQALSGGSAQTVGRFRFYIDEERWEWSDEVQQMHGYAPGELPAPTTAQVLAHKHPDDHEHFVGALEDTRRTRAAFSTRHRMIDANGVHHRLVVVGDQLRDESGAVVGTHGFYIDVTPAEAAYEGRISAAVADVSDRRVVIEHAKGMLGLLYGLDAEAAFALLKWRSQEANVKLRALAVQLVEDFRALSGQSDELPPRRVYDQTLMTVHERVSDRESHAVHRSSDNT